MSKKYVTYEYLKELEKQISEMAERLMWTDVPLFEKDIINNKLFDLRKEVHSYSEHFYEEHEFEIKEGF